jgi:hypothetical protein
MAKTVVKGAWKPLPKAKRRSKPAALRHRKKLGPRSHLRTKF